MAKATGGSGSIVIGGISIGFQTIEPSVEKEYDDATDSTNFDTGTQIVHKSQLAVSTQTTIDVEGLIDLAIVPLYIVLSMYSNPGAVACSIKYNLGSTYGHGLVDISNFKATINPVKNLAFTMTLMSNGVFTPNS